MSNQFKRLTISEEIQAINAIQQKIDEAGAQWTAGHTSVSRLSPYEKNLMFGTLDEPIDPNVPIISYPHDVADDLPSSFDWRDVDGSDWMTPVRNQGACGSCWAFSVIGVFEACINIANDDPDYNIDLSEQHLVSDCCPGDCGGGYLLNTLRYIKNYGVSTEKCFPYQAKNSECTPCDDYKSYKIDNYVYMKPDTDSYKQAIQKYGPIIVTITVPNDWFYYTSGVYEPVLVERVRSAKHAVIATGWVDDDNIDTGGYWIIKNSWGTDWGESGYGKVKYGVIHHHGYAIINHPIISCHFTILETN